MVPATYSTRDLKGITGLDEATILEQVKSGKIPARHVNSNSYSTLLSITPDAIWELITGRSKPAVKPASELHYTRYGAVPIVRLNSIAHA